VGDEQHPKCFWGGVKIDKASKKQTEESITERLFRLRSCLPNWATEHKGWLRPEYVEGRRSHEMGATTKTDSNSLKIRKNLIIMKGGKK